MKIIVYHCAEAPKAARYLARMIGRAAGAKKDEILPLTANGTTEAEAREKLQRAWDEGIERERAHMGLNAGRLANVQKARAARAAKKKAAET